MKGTPRTMLMVLRSLGSFFFRSRASPNSPPEAEKEIQASVKRKEGVFFVWHLCLWGILDALKRRGPSG